jgi:cold shock CspA family protein
MTTGNINSYFPERAYGFINAVLKNEKNEDTLASVFFHLNDVTSGVPAKSARVSFEPVKNAKGWAAKNVVVLDEAAFAAKAVFNEF